MNVLKTLWGALSSFLQGFLVTLVVVGLIVIGLYIKQIHWDTWTEEVPLIATIDDVYSQSLQNLVDVGEYAIENFYKLNEEVQINSVSATRVTSKDPDEFTVYLTWDQQEVKEHLAERGWSKSKVKGSQRVFDYIQEYMDEALLEMARTKIPASIKLAQGILESNCGESRLAVRGNNHFGMKAPKKKSVREKRKAGREDLITDDDFILRDPAVGFMTLNDDHVWDRFLVFVSALISYQQHSRLLTARKKPGKKSNYGWIWTSYPVGSDVDISDMADVHNQTGACNIRASEFYNGKTTVPYYMACAAGLKMAGYATSKTYHKKLTRIIETYELWRLDYDLINSVSN